jgi:hypothetical protein
METASGELEVELFALLILGDDRVVRQTYVAGEPRKDAPSLDHRSPSLLARGALLSPFLE